MPASREWGDAWNGPIELWRKVVDINLFGVVHGIRSFLPIMDEQGLGHIVSTASMAGLVAMPGAGAVTTRRNTRLLPSAKGCASNSSRPGPRLVSASCVPALSRPI